MHKKVIGWVIYCEPHCRSLVEQNILPAPAGNLTQVAGLKSKHSTMPL